MKLRAATAAFALACALTTGCDLLTKKDTPTSPTPTTPTRPRPLNDRSPPTRSPAPGPRSRHRRRRPDAAT